MDISRVIVYKGDGRGKKRERNKMLLCKNCSTLTAPTGPVLGYKLEFEVDAPGNVPRDLDMYFTPGPLPGKGCTPGSACAVGTPYIRSTPYCVIRLLHT